MEHGTHFHRRPMAPSSPRPSSVITSSQVPGPLPSARLVLHGDSRREVLSWLHESLTGDLSAFLDRPRSKSTSKQNGSVGYVGAEGGRRAEVPSAIHRLSAGLEKFSKHRGFYLFISTGPGTGWVLNEWLNGLQNHMSCQTYPGQIVSYLGSEFFFPS